MPLVTIDLLEGRPPHELDAIADAIHEAMVDHLGVPRRDRFQIVTQHTPETLRFDRSYLDIPRTDAFVLIRVTLAAGRTTEAKQAFYASVAERLASGPAFPPRTWRSPSSRTPARTGPSAVARPATWSCLASSGVERGAGHPAHGRCLTKLWVFRPVPGGTLRSIQRRSERRVD